MWDKLITLKFVYLDYLLENMRGTLQGICLTPENTFRRAVLRTRFWSQSIWFDVVFTVLRVLR